MSLVRGPFTIKWGANTIEDIEDISPEHSVATEDYETIQGRTIEIDGATKVSATITLLATDVASLAVLLPQYFVAMGAVLSTGETVTDSAGAIDVVPHDCAADITYNDLDVISCGASAKVFRIVNARTKIDGVEIDNKIQKVKIKFIGEADSDEATIQFFAENGISVVS
jgi:hypothetical protein